MGIAPITCRSLAVTSVASSTRKQAEAASLRVCFTKRTRSQRLREVNPTTASYEQIIKSCMKHSTHLHPLAEAPPSPSARIHRIHRLGCTLLLLWLVSAASIGQAQPFTLNFREPTLDRWMYPHNATPGTRASAPVFGTLSDAAGVDARQAQLLLGFDTLGLVPTQLGPKN